MSDDIEYSFSADMSELVDGLDEGADAANESLSKVGEAASATAQKLDGDLAEGAKHAGEEAKKASEEFVNMGEALEGIQSKIKGAFEAVGITALYEAAEKLVEKFEEIARGISEITTGAAELGVTTEEFQVMQEVVKESDGNMQRFTLTAARLRETLERSRAEGGNYTAELLKLGIITEDTNNKNFGLVEALTRIHDRLSDAATKTDELSGLQAVFGARVAALVPIFKAFDGSAEQAESILKSINAVTDENIDTIEKANKTWANFTTSARNTFVEFAADVIDGFHKIKELQDFSPEEKEDDENREKTEAAKRAAEQQKVIAQNTADAAKLRDAQEAAEFEKSIKQQVQFAKDGSLAKIEILRQEAAAVQKVEGDKADNEHTKAAYATLAKAVQEYTEKQVAGAKQVADTEASSQEKVVAAHMEAARKILDAQLAQKEISPETYAIASIAVVKQIEAAEVAMYQKKESLLVNDGVNNQANAAERINLEAEIVAAHLKSQTQISSIDAKETEELKKQIGERLTTRMEEAKVAETVALDQQADAKKILDAQDAEHKISPATYETAMIAVYNNMLNAQLTLYAEERAKADEELAHKIIDAEQYKAKVLQIDTEIAKARSQNTLQIQAVEDKTTKEIEKNWQEIGKQIAGSFDSAIDGMLKKTETFQQAFKKMGSELALDFINNTINRMLEKWITAEGQKVAQSEIGQKVLQALGIENLAVAKTTSSAQSLGDITDAAAVAAANAFASTAAIPYIGLELAPAAAAAADAEVMAFASQLASAAGGWKVPSDQLAMVHQDEMILPRHISQGIQERIISPQEKDSQSGSTNHFHMSTMDSKSFEKFLDSQSHRNSIAKVVNKASIRGNRALRMKI